MSGYPQRPEKELEEMVKGIEASMPAKGEMNAGVNLAKEEI